MICADGKLNGGHQQLAVDNMVRCSCVWTPSSISVHLLHGGIMLERNHISIHGSHLDSVWQISSDAGTMPGIL